MKASIAWLVLPSTVAAQLLGLPHRIIPSQAQAPYATLHSLPGTRTKVPLDYDTLLHSVHDVVTDDIPDASTPGVAGDILTTSLAAIPGLAPETTIEDVTTSSSSSLIDNSVGGSNTPSYTSATDPHITIGDASFTSTLSLASAYSFSPSTTATRPTSTVAQSSELTEPPQPSWRTLSTEQRTAISIGIVAALGVAVALIALRVRIYNSIRRKREERMGSRIPYGFDPTCEKVHYPQKYSVRPTSLPVPAHVINAQRWDRLQYYAIYKGWSAQPGDLIPSGSSHAFDVTVKDPQSAPKYRWPKSY